MTNLSSTSFSVTHHRCAWHWPAQLPLEAVGQRGSKGWSGCVLAPVPPAKPEGGAWLSGRPSHWPGGQADWGQAPAFPAQVQHPLHPPPPRSPTWPMAWLDRLGPQYPLLGPPWGFGTALWAPNSGLRVSGFGCCSRPRGPRGGEACRDLSRLQALRATHYPHSYTGPGSSANFLTDHAQAVHHRGSS